MLNRVMERMLLRGVPVIGRDGAERREDIGEVRGTLVSRSAEETEEDGLDRAVQTVYAVIPDRYSPRGGFRRGMELHCADGGCCRVLTPVRCGAWWSLKCSRSWL